MPRPGRWREAAPTCVGRHRRLPVHPQDDNPTNAVAGAVERAPVGPPPMAAAVGTPAPTATQAPAPGAVRPPEPPAASAAPAETATTPPVQTEAQARAAAQAALPGPPTPPPGRAPLRPAESPADSDAPVVAHQPAAAPHPDAAPRSVAVPPDAPVVLRGATREFGADVGVFDIDLEVPPGSILGVVGPSGAGKTTTIRLITGALAPTAGLVRVLGEDPQRFRRTTRERIGYMPQLFSLYPDLTADENVDFAASLFGLLAPRRRRRVAEVLALVDLLDVRGRRAGRLSGGMQRRLELACALVHEPSLLILDEPTAGIDPILRERIWAELARLKGDGRTVLVTTQYVAEADLCDGIALIGNGRLIASGAPEDLRRGAAGGDVIDAETAAPFDPASLVGRDGIRSARSTGLRTFRLVVDDAGVTTPLLDDLVEEAGGTLASAREIRLTFDEVFTALVERADAATGETATSGQTVEAAA
jgi:ABC-2 type transport system ATP-binding protein